MKASSKGHLQEVNNKAKKTTLDTLLKKICFPDAACGGDLQWRQFHKLVFGRPCRAVWFYKNTEVVAAGTFDDDYNCNFAWNRPAVVESRGLPMEMGKYGKVDLMIQTKLCNLAWRKSQHDIPDNAVQAREDKVYGNQYVGRKFIDEATYRYGKIHDFKSSTIFYPNKDLTTGESSDFDILVCND